MKFLTLKFGERYSADYVNKLYKGIKRNSSDPFDFYCYTENPEGLDENVKVIELVKRKGVRRHWYRFDFHDMPFLKGHKCVVMDIDAVITGSIDEVINFDLPKGHYGALPKWWGEGNNINGGFQMFYQGETKYLSDEFNSRPSYWQTYYFKTGRSPYLFGEQLFIEEHLKQDITFLPKEWFARFGSCEGKTGTEAYNLLEKYWKENVDSQRRMIDINGKIHDKIKYVQFSGNGNWIEEHNQVPFVKEYWT